MRMTDGMRRERRVSSGRFFQISYTTLLAVYGNGESGISFMVVLVGRGVGRGTCEMPHCPHGEQLVLSW